MSTIEQTPGAEHSTSVIACIDGPSKAGKTELIRQIEAGYTDVTEGDSEVIEWLERSEQLESGLHVVENGPRFSDVRMISCGNYFRALALFKAIAECEFGEVIDEFDPHEHTPPVLELLAVPDIEHTLQNDIGIGATVSTVAAMPGAQGLAGSIFREHVKASHRAGNRTTLTIADAREPVEWLLREEGLIGRGEKQIDSRSVIPTYLDNRPRVAALREDGDFDEVLAVIERRRFQDENRDEFPFSPPQTLLEWSEWRSQIMDMERTEIADPLYIDNNPDGIDRLRQLGILIAAHALIASHSLRQASQELEMVEV